MGIFPLLLKSLQTILLLAQLIFFKFFLQNQQVLTLLLPPPFPNFSFESVIFICYICKD